MSYAYLVVTLDVTVRPPRVLGASVHDKMAKTLPPEEGRFKFDVMAASGRTFDAAKHNLFVMSKVAHYASQTKWAFQLLPPNLYGEWLVTPTR